MCSLELQHNVAPPNMADADEVTTQRNGDNI